MKKIIFCLVTLSVVVLLGGCSGPANGTVEWLTDGASVQKVTVLIDGQETLTNSSGNFQFEKVANNATNGEVLIDGWKSPFKFTRKNKESTKIVVNDAQIKIILSENAAEPKDVKKYTLLLDGEKVTDALKLNHLECKEYIIEIQSIDHEANTQTVTLKPGVNQVKIKLNLTPKETYQRFSDSLVFDRFYASWKYIHPDERSKYSQKKWVKYWNKAHKETEDTLITFKDPRMLKTWTAKWMKKTYSNVAEIDRTIKYQVISTKYSDFGKSYTDNASQHWVQNQGRWYIIHNGDPNKF